ncbi:MAG: DUF4019 domain-containing protein [Telluria sp.]
MSWMPRLIATSIAVFALVGCSSSEDAKLAETAVQQFHQKLDAGQFEAIYAAAGAELKDQTTLKDFTALLEAIHRKLGNLKSAEAKGWNVNYNTSGAYVTLTYASVFNEGGAGEQFVYRIDRNEARLIGYHINSAALILK